MTKWVMHDEGFATTFEELEEYVKQEAERLLLHGLSKKARRLTQSQMRF